jgi:Nucleotidyl transferase of unknown function (DUF2204)
VGGATRAFFVDVLRNTLRILREADADHLVIGGLATRTVLQMPLSVAEDVDVLIRRDDVERLLDRFAEAGYTVHRRDERWVMKVAMPDVTVDLIFLAGQAMRLDDEHLRRSNVGPLEDIELPIPSTEDLVVMKAMFDAEDRQGKWYGALALLRRPGIDWDYLAFRGLAHAPRRLLSLLLYASDAGIEVPAGTFERLVASAVPAPGARGVTVPR